MTHMRDVFSYLTPMGPIQGFRMPASDSGATYTSGRRPKAAKERTRGGWGAENAAHSAMGIWLMRKV